MLVSEKFFSEEYQRNFLRRVSEKFFKKSIREIF
jgi:hypothetical protein